MSRNFFTAETRRRREEKRFSLRLCVSAVILPLLLSTPLRAAEAPAFPRASYFRHHFQTPQTRIQLEAPARLEEFVAGG
jgi:hypothetical protein